MLKVLADDVGEHDLFHPCCRKEMFEFFSRNGDGHSNYTDNINGALGTQYPIITPVNPFMHTQINPDGTTQVLAPVSKADDQIILEALEDLALGVAACSVAGRECNSGKCSSVKVIVE